MVLEHASNAGRQARGVCMLAGISPLVRACALGCAVLLKPYWNGSFSAPF
jgi:hypothetical protein